MPNAKTLDLASKISTECGNLMTSLRRLIALGEEAERAGIPFASEGVPMSFADTSLAHVHGDDINSALSSAAAVKSWLDAERHSDNFDRARA